MGNELALDVNVICLLILGLFFVCVVTALAGPLVAGVSYVALWLYGLSKGRAEMRRAQAEGLEAEAAAAVAEAEAAVAEAAVAEAEAVIAAALLDQRRARIRQSTRSGGRVIHDPSMQRTRAPTAGVVQG